MVVYKAGRLTGEVILDQTSIWTSFLAGWVVHWGSSRAIGPVSKFWTLLTRELSELNPVFQAFPSHNADTTTPLNLVHGMDPKEETRGFQLPDREFWLDNSWLKRCYALIEVSTVDILGALYGALPRPLGLDDASTIRWWVLQIAPRGTYKFYNVSSEQSDDLVEAREAWEATRSTSACSNLEDRIWEISEDLMSTSEPAIHGPTEGDTSWESHSESSAKRSDREEESLEED